MTIKLIQNKTKKDNTIYYTMKADQDGILNVIDGQYIADKNILAMKLQPVNDGDIEVIAFKDRKVVPAEPFEFPVQVNLKLDPKDGTNKEKALHSLFTSHPEVSLLAGGFAGEIGFADSLAVKRIAEGKGKPDDYQSFLEIVAVESTIDIAAAGASTSFGGGYSKGQTQAEVIADRLDFLSRIIAPDSKELEILTKVHSELQIEIPDLIALVMGK